MRRLEEAQREEHANAERSRERLEAVEAEARQALREHARELKEMTIQRDRAVAEASRLRDGSEEHTRLEVANAHLEQQTAILRDEKGALDRRVRKLEDDLRMVEQRRAAEQLEAASRASIAEQRAVEMGSLRDAALAETRKVREAMADQLNASREAKRDAEETLAVCRAELRAANESSRAAEERVASENDQRRIALADRDEAVQERAVLQAV